MNKPYVQIATEIGQLLEKKNAAYGDSFEQSGEILKILFPNGISHEQMTDALCIIRIVDKLFRIATDKDAFGESPFRDIGGYAILGLINGERKNQPTQHEALEGPGVPDVHDGALQLVHPTED